MKLQTIVPIAFLVTTVGLSACEDNHELTTGVDVNASTEFKLAYEGANEPLQSSTLRKKICEAIVRTEGVAGHEDACEGFTYTVTRFGRSTVYGYLQDGRPITMTMDVSVEDPANEVTYQATLNRHLDAVFGLTFEAKITSSDLEAAHDFIRELAQDAGEYGDFWRDDVASRVEAVAWGNLPTDIQATFDKAIETQAFENCYAYELGDEEGECPHGAALNDDVLFRILREGEPVGYVLGIYDSIDHPLWDGSGVYVFYDLNGTEVTSVSWSG